ncbi:MAG: EAL domain-containing response regulator [Burkholderiales bacterium]|nr:EAL domain-containing response regulator [Burkholderiales bacterium]
MVDKPEVSVLLLDDDPFMLKLLGLVLAGLGYTGVTGCESGRAALDWIDAAERAPDLILLDLNMPGMDGVEFVRHLVDRRYGGALILVSGEDDRMLLAAESLVRAHRLTVLGRLHKAVTPAALAALLEPWVPRALDRPTVAKRLYPADEVRAAIVNGELENHYQPTVVVASGRVVGVEALVRWRHPVDGMVYPDQFIGVAEDHGLIGALTMAVLRAALTQARRWRDAGLALRVAINVSMDDLAALDFPDVVAAQAAAAGVPPEAVVLEVTESRLMKDLRTPLEVLARLRLKRFSLSIDDFGTGHSSLAQLRNFPFDELKVDRGFVHGACADETLRAIYDASLGLARQLGMGIVAEGVEDLADWDFLRRTGCAMAQGYFIARPMPADAVPGWIPAWESRSRDERLLPPDTGIEPS